MPEANAREWSKLAISPTNAEAGLEEFKDFAVGTVVIRFGKRSVAQTRQGDATVRYVKAKSEPGFTLDITPDLSALSTAPGALRILTSPTNDEQYVDFRLPDGGTNTGIKLTGKFFLDVEDFTAEEDGRKMIRVTGRPVGEDWTVAYTVN